MCGGEIQQCEFLGERDRGDRGGKRCFPESEGVSFSLIEGIFWDGEGG